MIGVQNKSMTISQATTQLVLAYSKLINTGLSLKKFPSVMLWGSPGVGKSQGVRQIADDISACTGKRVEVTDVRLLLFNPVDLRGIPTSNADKTLAVWLKPKIFQMDESSDVINILFLDDAAGNRVTDRSVAYQMPKALANRLCHIEIESDEKSWHEWAVNANVHKYVMGFLERYPAMLMQFAPENSDLAFLPRVRGRW